MAQKGLYRAGGQSKIRIVTSLTAGKKSGDTIAQLVASLREQVANQQIRPGDKLPPERALAAEFKVNRATLRMALSALEVMGVVVRRVGDGTYLSSDSERMLQAPMDFLILVDDITAVDLLQARLMLEPELAARAAERATLFQLNELKAALQKMGDSGTDLEHLAEADIAFHEGIARASGNRTVYRMFSVINRAMHRLLSVTLHSEPLARKVRVHNGILDAIHRREPELARERMRAHLMETLTFIEGKH